MFNSIFYKFKELFPKKDCKFTKNVKKLTFLILFLFEINPKHEYLKGFNNICIGESVTLSATGAISYLWDNGVTSSTQVITPSTSATITYSVVGTDANSCSANAQVNINVNPLPNTGPIFHN